MKRVLTAVLVGVAALGLMATPAHALTKVRSAVPLTTGLTLAGFCPFPIEYNDLSGSVSQVLVFDDNGDLVKIDVYFRGVTTELSANGKSITFNDSGTLEIVPQPDGTDLVTLNGHSNNGDQGLITGEPFVGVFAGHVVIASTFNPDTGFNDFLSIAYSGSFTDVCEALAA